MQYFKTAYRAAAFWRSYEPDFHKTLFRCFPAAFLFVSLLSFTLAPCHAFEASVSSDEAPLVTPSRPAMGGDPCLPLLRAFQAEPSSSAMSRGRRSAGEEPAVALVFGVRFAMGPEIKKRGAAHNDSAQFGVWEPGSANDPQSLALSDYRRCKNDSALKALGEEWRWSR